MCLTMVDPATGWFEIVELPITNVTVQHEGESVSEVIIDKTLTSEAHLWISLWSA